MSFRVSVICEDHTLDQYIAVPVIAALCAAAGKPHARVRAIATPPPRGIEAVTHQLADQSERYAVISDLVVYTLDADGLDGEAGRADRKAQLEARRVALSSEVSEKVLILLAQQELEVWALWAARQSLAAPWSSVRSEPHPKDVYWPTVLTRADTTMPGQGRARLIRDSLAAGWNSLAQGCPELAEAVVDFRGRLAGA